MIREIIFSVMLSPRTLLPMLLAATLSLSASAAVVYDESVSGNASPSGLTPTVVLLAQGSNQILGTNGNATAASLRDYFAFTIPTGLMLTSLTLLDTNIGNIGFIGLQAGNQITLPTNTATAAGLLGWWHYVLADKGTDILPHMAIAANGSSGFTVPLGAGTYALWIQDSSTGTFNYGFDLELQPTPEPATWALTAIAVGVIYSRRRRNS